MELPLLFSPDWQTQPPETEHIKLRRFAMDKASLTDKIKALCRAEFSVQVLYHGFIPAPAIVSKSLKVDAGESVLRREVLLQDGAVPLVYACSLLPESALCGDYAELKQLGSRPLGHWLFSEPALVREPMQYLRLPGRLLPHQTGCGGDVLGRKTLFMGAGKPFLVSEFFLPALLDRL